MPKKIDLVKRGSETAKGGFRNEGYVIKSFNNWKKDKIAQKWLEAMNYKIKNIEYVKAIKVPNKHKADVQVQIKITIKLKSLIDVENLQVKLVTKLPGSNQVDKRKIDKYVEMWSMPAEIARYLKLFTGETSPRIKGLSDPRRMKLTEMESKVQKKIIKFINENKILIVSDILKGRGEFSADWMLVIVNIDNKVRWVLKSINEAMNIFGNGDVRITPQGSLKIGKIGMQRKGGDNGRESAKMLQFKICPTELFDD